MYNLLIVDDEQTIRSGLRSILDWESMGLRVIGDVRHGKEALSFMEKNTVHLLITDLKMPIMDGMELTQKINETYPDVKMVILSGYDDFEYARQAIKNNVQDYLLKPVSLKKLRELMASLCLDLDELYAQRENTDLNKQLLNDHQFELRYAVFRKGDYSSMTKLGFPETPVSCRIIICSSHDQSAEELRMIAEVLEEARGDGKTLVPFLIPGERLTILLSDSIPVEKLQEEFIRISGHEIIIGAGSPGDTWLDIKRSFEEAEQTYRARPFITTGSILSYKDIPEQYRTDITVGAEINDEADTLNLKLTENILNNDVWESLEVLEEITTLLRTSLSDFRVYQQELIKVIVISAYNLRRRGVDTGETSYHYSPLLASVTEIKNTKLMERWSQSIIRELCSHVSESREIKYKPLVKKAIGYMEKNYSQALKIEEVSDHLGISANYLSRIIKEETQLSFLNWLNRYRVDQSEKLLRDPIRKIYEISEEVGFSDYRYYTKVFRKIKGISPKEFRKTLS